MFKLKPCPFCGSEKVYFTGVKKYWVVCGNCGAEGPTHHVLWDYKGPAIKAWNERAQPEPTCKDCKNWDESWTPSYSDGTSHYCPMIDLVTDEHFYCKYGDFK